MALSQIQRKLCEVCGKVAVEKSRVNFGSSKLITLECGHVTSEEILVAADYASIKSSDGRVLMPYQIEGVKFMENADARAILADEQGLGKTVQALALIKLHPEKLLPAVIVCPTTVKLQWHHEIIRWCGVNGFLTQVIGSSKELAAPGFDVYITTYDLLKEKKKKKSKKVELFEGVDNEDDDDSEDSKTFQFVTDIKCIIIDECQRIKNHLSGRAKAIQKTVRDHKIDHIIPMSGTYIKNNAGEAFTVLNLVAPRMFPQYNKFIENDCDSYNDGWGYKVGGLRNPEAFHEKTKDFILRRTKAEVLKDLPPLMRKFRHVELDRKLNKAYDDAMKELEEIMYDEDMGGSERSNHILAIMTKMRQITGIGKVAACVEDVTEFILSNDRPLTIFLHHQNVMTMLEASLNSYLESGGYGKCLMMTSALSAEGRANLAVKFKEDKNHRVMIASTLAAGEGLNLQFCSDAIILERQWNPANEEQAEARFHRFGQINPVSVSYMIASETIDQYFTELVEAKRAIVASTLDNKTISWDQQSLMKELAEAIVSRGRKNWKL